jgi:pantothenate kinase
MQHLGRGFLKFFAGRISVFVLVFLISHWCICIVSFTFSDTKRASLSPSRRRIDPLTMAVDNQMQETYASLANRILDAVKDVECDQQYWICIAGGPGSGKSTLSAAVVSLLNELSELSDFSVVLPMDGFHFSRKELKEMSEIDGSPSMDELLARRG